MVVDWGVNGPPPPISEEVGHDRALARARGSGPGYSVYHQLACRSTLLTVQHLSPPSKAILATKPVRITGGTHPASRAVLILVVRLINVSHEHGHVRRQR